MQSPASIGRALYRIVFRRGSPERIHYSQGLTVAALLAFVVLAPASQWLAFHADLAGMVLYPFTWITGLSLFFALLSRKLPRNRLRRSLQAMLLVLGAAHLALLLAAPLVASPGARQAIAVLLGIPVLFGLTNCVHYALGRSRMRALAYTLMFAFGSLAFYVTMLSLLEVALG